MKNLQEKHKLKELVIIKPALQKILKGIQHVEEKAR
jgi:hypothetical protein